MSDRSQLPVRSQVGPLGRLQVALTKNLPQRSLTWAMRRLAESKNPRVKNALIRLIGGLYHIDLADAAEQNPRAYPTFNAFFTRALKVDSRPLHPDGQALLSPVDATVSQAGQIHLGLLIQAKWLHYQLAELLADVALSQALSDGSYATLYLSPSDYHRVHLPCSAELVAERYIPGKLFSVNDASAALIPGLFVQNERLVLEFSASFGRFALVMVGAVLVAGIETCWHGRYKPGRDYSQDHRVNPLRFNRGDELGRFNMGSTVILLMPGQQLAAENLPAGQKVQMGQAIGRI